MFHRLSIDVVGLISDRRCSRHPRDFEATCQQIAMSRSCSSQAPPLPLLAISQVSIPALLDVGGRRTAARLPSGHASLSKNDREGRSYQQASTPNARADRPSPQLAFAGHPLAAPQYRKSGAVLRVDRLSRLGTSTTMHRLYTV